MKLFLAWLLWMTPLAFAIYSVSTTQIDVVCTRLGCKSPCFADTFCFDERVSKQSSSYVLEDHILLLKTQMIRITNTSLTGFIRDSFLLPLSMFTAETIEKWYRNETKPTAKALDTFFNVNKLDSSWSRLKVGDPYCVWSSFNLLNREMNMGNCVFLQGFDNGLDFITLQSDTGIFGTFCHLRRHIENGRT